MLDEDTGDFGTTISKAVPGSVHDDLQRNGIYCLCVLRLQL